MVNGQKKVHEKEKEYKSGLMVANTKVTGNKTKHMDMED